MLFAFYRMFVFKCFVFCVFPWLMVLDWRCLIATCCQICASTSNFICYWIYHFIWHLLNRLHFVTNICHYNYVVIAVIPDEAQSSHDLLIESNNLAAHIELITHLHSNCHWTLYLVIIMLNTVKFCQSNTM